MTISNKLTIFRIILVPVFVSLMLSDFTASNIWAVLVFILASLTDYLDGYLARSRNEITDFGKFLDPIADKILVISALLCLLEFGIIPSWSVIIIIAREFIVSGLRMSAASKNVVIAADKFGKMKTVLQMLSIILMMISLTYSWANYYNIALVFYYFSVILTVFSGCSYILKNKNVFYDKENEKWFLKRLKK